MPGVTYDTGALIAAERGASRLWQLHEEYLAYGITPVVPSPVLAEAWRGGSRQARLVHLLKSCEVEAMTEDRARAVGVLLGKARFDDVVDAAVVEAAARRGDVVVTSNEVHIRQLARAAQAYLDIVAV